MLGARKITRALLPVKYSSSSSPAASPVVWMAFWWQASTMAVRRALSGSTPKPSWMHLTNAAKAAGDVVVCLFLLSVELPKDTVPVEPMGFESRPMGLTPMGDGSKPMGFEAGSGGSAVANAADTECT